MTEFDIEKIDRIVSDLLLEFRQERNKLQIELDNANAKIMEIDKSISSFKENEDVDIKVFSPRNLSNLNIEKIEMMNNEKSKIEDSSKSVIKQLNYYSDKCDKLDEIKSILNGNISSSNGTDKIDNIAKMFSIDNSDNQVKDNDVFSTGLTLNNNSLGSLNENKKNTDVNEGTTDRVENIEKLSVSDNISVLVESKKVINETTSILENDNLSQYDKLSILKQLESLSHRLDLSIKIIDNDVYRTKMDLKSMKSNLDDLISSLKNSLK